MNVKSNNIDFSIYTLSLLQFLNESHPHLSKDIQFINYRGEGAAIIFELFYANGATIEESMAHANEFLFKGLHFSVHDMIKLILENEFASFIEPERFTKIATDLMPIVSPLIEKYNLNDNFENTPEYNLFYSEAVGAILIHFNSYGI